MLKLRYINQGTSQAERLPPKLLPENIKIDNRRTIDLIASLGNFATLLNYYKVDQLDGENQLQNDGDWSFFTKDPVFYLAEIATSKSSKKENDINLVLSTFQDSAALSDKIFALRLLFDVITDTLTLINKWLTFIDELPESFSFKLIKITQDNLSHQLALARGCALFYQKHAQLSKYNYFDPKFLKSLDKRYWQGLNDCYQIEKQEKELCECLKKISDPSPIKIINETYIQITSVAQNIVYNFNHIVNLAKSDFNKIIQGNGNMKPDLGLLVTFLELFENVQSKINGLTKDHLDFYYKNILKLKEAPLVPDKALLLMKLAAGCDEILIEKGTAFDAGKDLSGNTLQFSAIQSTSLNQIQIAEIKTLFAAANSLLQPDPPVSTSPFLTGIYSASHPLPIPATSDGFAVLGEDQLSYSEEQQTMQQTNLGFAFSSPVLFLSGGDRTLDIKLNFTASSFQNYFIKQLNALVISDQNVNGKKSSNKDASALFEKLFKDVFAITATGKKGWFPLVISQISYDSLDLSILITLKITPIEQAISAYNSNLHGPSYTTPYPIISMVLQPNYPYNCYNFLNNLELKNVHITTQVNEFNNITLYNQYGQIDSSKPFQPLGIQPDSGAYLQIGSKEMFIKNLSEIDIVIDLQPIPSPGYFTSYYAGYNVTPEITNDSFILEASFRNNNTWVFPAGSKKDFKLFNSSSITPKTGSNFTDSLNPSSTFQIQNLGSEVKCTSIDPATIDQPLKIDLNTPGGYIKFELINPSFGFGGSLYNNVLSNTILQNSQIQYANFLNKTNNPLNPLPNPPITPFAKAIYVNYKASDTINLMPGVKNVDGFTPFYHLDAFSIHSASTREVLTDNGLSNTKGDTLNQDKSITTDLSQQIGGYNFLLPHYDNEGDLYIGLEKLNPPASFNIFFQLSEKALDASVSELKGVKWSYLVANKWKNLDEGTTLNDATAGLTRSGIVRFNIPSDGSGVNTIMPNELFWIRVQATGQFSVFSNLTLISTQAVEVEYSNATSTRRESITLPFGSITKPIESIPNLKSVFQPFASKGGIAAENRNQFYTRVSERLRHKKRAVNLWDYENLALAKFPEIYKAKCIGSSNLKTTLKAGVTELVLIPYLNATIGNDNSQFGPSFGFTMLEEIKKYLQQYSSAHAQLTVRNPVYECLTIKCQVKFIDDSAFKIKNLNDDIRDFLSPWRTTNSSANNIGESIQKSSILGFIQQLSYVEFVTGFSIIKITEIDKRYHFYDSAKTSNENKNKLSDEGYKEQSVEDDMLYALTPYSVFISAQKHLITIIEKVAFSRPETIGINDLSIDMDFVITGEENEKTPLSNKQLYHI